MIGFGQKYCILMHVGAAVWKDRKNTTFYFQYVGMKTE